MNAEHYLKILLISDIAKSEDFSEIMSAYKNNVNFLKDVAIIKSTNNESSIDLYSQFSGIPDIRKQLYTPFKYGKVNHVCFESIYNYFEKGEFYSREQRCISFDTQTISYIDKYYRGKSSSLPQNIQSVIDLLDLKTVSLDTTPYVMENLLFSDQNEDEVMETLISFEKVFSKNKKSDYFCRKEAQKHINLYKKHHFDKINEIVRLYYAIYAIILKSVIIQFENAKRTIDKKMGMLCDFIDSELCCLMIPEIIVAKRYFEKGQNYSFFGKVQKNRNDILKVLKNMTWDLMHLRIMERCCAYANRSEIILFIPYMFTYDERLREVKDCYELDALGIWKTERIVLPVYANINEITSYLQKISKPSDTYNRAENINKVSFSDLISELEEQLLKII